MADVIVIESSWTPSAALANVDNYREDLIDLLEVWKRQSPRLLAQMRDGLAESDAEKVFIAAHTLKSSTQILSLDDDVITMREIESAARAVDLSRAASLLETWEPRFQWIERMIDQFLAESQG